MYFMDMDLGVPITDKGQYQIYQEKEDRLYLKTCVHDMTHGCYVADADEDLYNIGDQTLIYGNLQAEKYFRAHKEAVKEWLKVKKEYDSYQYTKDNLCIIIPPEEILAGCHEEYAQHQGGHGIYDCHG